MIIIIITTYPYRLDEFLSPPTRSSSPPIVKSDVMKVYLRVCMRTTSVDDCFFTRTICSVDKSACLNRICRCRAIKIILVFSILHLLSFATAEVNNIIIIIIAGFIFFLKYTHLSDII